MKKTADLLKKFEQEHEVYVSADDSKFYWIVTARIPKKEEILHHTHRGKTYVSGLNQEGNVLVLTEPELSENYTIESWGTLDSFDEFVEKALVRILEDKEEYDKGFAEGCGTQCA